VKSIRTDPRNHAAEGDERLYFLARRFHEAYERLAPAHGYVTRPESAVPWENVPESNRNLMQAVVRDVFGDTLAALDEVAAYGYEWDGTADIARDALDRLFSDAPENQSEATQGDKP
jgi:hypothetical protein